MRAVPALVVPTMAYVAVDVSVVPWAPALPVPVLATKVAVSAPAAPFDVDVALTAALRPCGLPRCP